MPASRRTFFCDPEPGTPMPIALPSLGEAVAAAHRTLRRFPLVILAAAVAATANILMMEEVGPDWTHERLLTTAVLGMGLFTALQLFAERLRRRGAWPVLHLVGLLALAGFFAGYEWWSQQIFFGRFTQLAIAFYLLILILPFARRGLPNAFWHFGRILLERGVLTAVFGVVLWLGLVLALAAADNLFGVDVPPTGYGRLWAVVTFVFGSWFFLGGVPADVEALELQRDYPAVIRVFAQYVLVPLVSAYLVILTLYLGKVVVTWNWPSGWIGYLVTGVAAAGIFAILLVHPDEAAGGRPWVATFTRQFWIGILPSVVMLWLALYQRIHQYGLTEPRYFLGVLSVWLGAIAVYYAVTRSRNIAVIPASLALVALITLAGPWSGYAMSERSQVRRLRATLERNGMLADGTLRPAPREVSAEDRAEISGSTRYLVEVHGTDAIAPWFADTAVRRAVVAAGVNGRVHADEVDRWADTAVTHLGVRYEPPSRPTGVRHFRYPMPEMAAVPVREYDYLLPLRGQPAGAAESSYVAVWSPRPLAVRVLRAGDTVLVARLDSMLARLRERDRNRQPTYGRYGVRLSPPDPGLRPEMFVADAEGRGVRGRVTVQLLEGTDSAGVVRVERMVGRVLLAVRR